MQTIPLFLMRVRRFAVVGNVRNHAAAKRVFLHVARQIAYIYDEAAVHGNHPRHRRLSYAIRQHPAMIKTMHPQQIAHLFGLVACRAGCDAKQAAQIFGRHIGLLAAVGKKIDLAKRIDDGTGPYIGAALRYGAWPLTA